MRLYKTIKFICLDHGCHGDGENGMVARQHHASRLPLKGHIYIFHEPTSGICRSAEDSLFEILVDFRQKKTSGSGD